MKLQLNIEINAKSKKEVLKHLLTVFKLLLDEQESQATSSYHFELRKVDYLDFE